MSKAEKVGIKTETPSTMEAVVKRLNDLEAKLRRYSDNWKKFAATHLGVDAQDGAIKGSVRVAVLIGVLVCALVGVAVATDYLIMENPGDTTKFSVDTDGNVYAAGALQIDSSLSVGTDVTVVGGDVLTTSTTVMKFWTSTNTYITSNSTNLWLVTLSPARTNVFSGPAL